MGDGKMRDAFEQRRPGGLPEGEWQVRCELAAAYRLFGQLGWHELIYNHLTVRVPGTPHFLINPFGLMYREVTASNLVKIDVQGRKVDPSPWNVNPAGFVVHSAVHAAREDAHCVMHTHTTAGQVVSCQEGGLLALSFNSMFYAGRVAYHDFEGITLDGEESQRLAADLGDRNVMILRNHGLLTCGPTVAHAFAEMRALEDACNVQIMAQAGGGPLRMPPIEVARKSAQQHDRNSRGGGGAAVLQWAAVRRWMERVDPGFLQ
jgi:ribulose-5-phosphate 4-epimerase/fuculose-1-phosphate aldolase